MVSFHPSPHAYSENAIQTEPEPPDTTEEGNTELASLRPEELETYVEM